MGKKPGSLDSNECEICGGKEWVATGNKIKAKMNFNKVSQNKVILKEGTFFVSEFTCKRCGKTKRYFPDYVEDVYDKNEKSGFVGLPRLMDI